MFGFLKFRILQSILIMIFMSFAVYCLIGLMPGDPIDIMVAGNPEATPEDVARLKEIYGLNQPLLSRYWNWLSAAITGDFGYSRLYSKPVLDILIPRAINSFILLSISMAISILIAIPLAIYAAKNQYKLFDNLVNLFCFAGISIPPFWFALMLISLFSVSLGWLPSGGLSEPDASIQNKISYFILPVISLSLASLAGYTRYTRSSMLEVLSQDFIRTARAKGCSNGRTLINHGLRNAMIPVTTIIALDFGTLFSGSLIIETMYAYPGMGKLIYDSIMGNDYNIALIGLLLITAMILIGNILADIIYKLLDPRINFKGAE